MFLMYHTYQQESGLTSPVCPAVSDHVTYAHDMEVPHGHDLVSRLRTLRSQRDTPLYVQLKHRIALLIASQAFDTKTPLPRELEICARLELSRATVRRCFQDLVIEGRVVRKRGQGTFIKPQTSAPGIDLA